MLQPVGSGEDERYGPDRSECRLAGPGDNLLLQADRGQPGQHENPVSVGGHHNGRRSRPGQRRLPAGDDSYQSIAELNAREAKEDKKLPNPSITKGLTNAQKLKKALKACSRDKGRARRARCVKQANARYGGKKKGRKA